MSNALSRLWAHRQPRARQLAGRGFSHLLLIGIGARAIVHGPILVKDTTSYVESAVYRSGLYPMFLSLLQGIFGDHADTATVVVQTGLILTAVAILVAYLGRGLDLANWQTIVITVLLSLPVLEPLEVGNRILTEGVAYFFFLLAVRFLLLALETNSSAPTIAFFLISALCVLTRTQFVFLYPVAALLVLWSAVSNRNWRGSALLAVTLLVTITAGSALDRGYRYWKHNEYISIPFIGLQLMAPALYLSKAEDTARLDPKSGELLRALRDRASDAGLLVESNPDPGGVTSYAHHYSQVFNGLVWRTVAPVLAIKDLGKPQLISARDFVAAEQTLRPMAVTLIRARPRAHLRLYVANLLAGMGISYALLLALVGPLLVWQGLVLRHHLAMVIAALLILHVANCGLVALVEPVEPRYIFYTEWPLLAGFFLLVSQNLRRTSKRDNALQAP